MGVMVIGNSAKRMLRWADGRPWVPDALSKQWRSHRPDEIFLAVESQRIVGHASLWWKNVSPLDGQTTGYVGHYHADHHAIASPLLQACQQALHVRGVEQIIGPMDGSTWHRYRFVTKSLGEPAGFFLEPHNPPEAPQAFEQAGFKPLAKYVSGVVRRLVVDDPKLTRIQDKLRDTGCVITTATSHQDILDQLPQVHELSQESFRSNFLFSPIDRDDFIQMYEQVIPAADPAFVFFAHRAGRLEGYAFALPDLAQKDATALRRIIVKTVATRRSRENAGLGRLLVDACHRAASSAGYVEAIHALMHEDNQSRNISGEPSQVIREYTLYHKPLNSADESASCNIAQRLAWCAHHWPRTAALVDERRKRRHTRTFGSLARRVELASSWLRSQGLAPGDRVLIGVPLSTRLYEVLLAVMHAGGVCVIPGPGITRGSIAHACVTTTPKMVIGSGAFYLYTAGLSAVRNCALKIRTDGCWPGTKRWCQNVQRTPGLCPIVRQADDLALITFTSGGTGTPKAVGRSHGLLLAQNKAVGECIALEPGQVDLLTLGVFALTNIAQGVTTVMPRFDVRRPAQADPSAIETQANQEKVNRLTCSPALLQRLVDHLHVHKRTLVDMTHIHTGGAPVFPALLDRAREVMPNARISALYGSTEAEPIANLHWADHAAELGAKVRQGAGLPAGKVSCHAQVRLLNTDGQPSSNRWTEQQLHALTQPAGMAGEIIVTGDHVVKGYLNADQDASTKIHVDGKIWHRTGDVGRFDADGMLWLLGRVRACVTSGDKTLYPFEVEAAAAMHEHIARCALLPVNGEPILLVQPRSAGDVDKVLHDMRKLAGKLGVSGVSIVKRIPLDHRHNAKVDYPALMRPTFLSKLHVHPIASNPKEPEHS